MRPIVRASKYRHVYGQAAKKELCYENLHPTLNAFDSNLLQSNGKYIALNAAGIGAIIVLPVTETGKAPEKVPYFRGHTGGSVLDSAFDPFDDQRFISCGEDGRICVWQIPEDFSFTQNRPPEGVKEADWTPEDVKPVQVLTGHTRKVGHVMFSPVAQDVVASASFDYTVKLWNVQTGACEVTLKHPDLVTSFCFNWDGSKLATTCRDKKIRVFDVPSGMKLAEGKGHSGAKSSRVIWLGDSERLLTTGFDRYSERELGLWKADAIDEGPLGGFYPVDSSSGIMMPFYDASTHIAFVAGKGDGNIRYYEYEDDQLYYISEFPSTAAQRGMAVIPKRAVSVKDNEILRAYKLLNDNSVEPISFIVPRRAEMFQDDIYPDAPSKVPALSAAEYFEGKTVSGPVLLSMRDVYEGKDPETKEYVKPKVVKEVKEEPKVEPKVEPKEPKVEPKVTKIEPQPEPTVKQTTSNNMFSQSSVNGLLDRVKNSSDDESQEVDEAWEKVEKSESPKKMTPAATPAIVEKTPAAKAASPVSAKSTRQSSPPATPAMTTATTTSSSLKGSPIKKAAGGLKANVEKLQSLIVQLEASVETLNQSNAAKDERLRALEEKVDQLLLK